MAGLYDPVARGSEIELMVAAKIVGLGGTACVPFGHGQGYDLISDFNSTLLRLQVRRAYRHETRDRWECGVYEKQSYYADGARRQRKIPYRGEGFDLLVVFADPAWYVIPSALLVGRSMLVFRPPGCRARVSGVAPAFLSEDFLDQWTLLKGGG